MPASAFTRDRSLERLASERFDVLVIGGGITGAGVALDAAARGLAVALVEGDDWGAGTSSKSSKLVHGGLRYLQQRDYLLVREGLVERQRLLANAPHLVKPLAFLIPLFGRDGVVNRAVAKAYSTALWSYDLVGGMKIGMRHRRIDRAEAARLFPPLRADLLVAGFIYWDARTDDARLTLAVTRTAADHGAAAANHAPVVELTRDGQGKVSGAVLGPSQLGASGVGRSDTSGLRIEARAVVNASGVWADHVRQLGEPQSPSTLRPAKGVHITLPAEKLRTDVAVVLPVLGDRRSIFVVPWGRFVYVGTTDTDYDGALDDPQCTTDDVAYLVSAVNAFVSSPISESDVLGTWAGLRPLVKEAATERTADLSRRHHVGTSADGLVTVTGGKLTTYRRMAADAVDAAMIQLGRGGRRLGRSPTKRLRLHGAGGSDGAIPPGPGGATLDAATVEHLRGRFGSDAGAVAELATSRPELAQPLVPGLPYLAAEAVWAAREEMALSLEDVLARRTRAAILDRDATAAAGPDVAALLGPEMGWDDAEQHRRVSEFRSRLDAERRAVSTR
ncbi:MAG TPA: glycerol-3-phosphate dehydrogenase/oxidase [Acidimicrobiales bacterium]|nr:glycerol-3-phosphate dehydrogenase/oxidase [Acidimicrobiales bacterium]